jgi:hypothetical protein
MISTRVDPPWSLARFRVRNQLVEIRAADLRFTTEETVVFLKEVMVSDLSVDNVAGLEERTGISPAQKEDIKAKVKDVQTPVIEAGKKMEKETSLLVCLAVWVDFICGLLFEQNHTGETKLIRQHKGEFDVLWQSGPVYRFNLRWGRGIMLDFLIHAAEIAGGKLRNTFATLDRVWIVLLLARELLRYMSFYWKMVRPSITSFLTEVSMSKKLHVQLALAVRSKDSQCYIKYRLRICRGALRLLGSLH